ncbi:MAG: hypothetical protein NTX56_04875 [Proteobacteria bacterium]|nr:hypothetical protein [Pseudomonadota bacterium]
MLLRVVRYLPQRENCRELVEVTGRSHTSIEGGSDGMNRREVAMLQSYGDLNYGEAVQGGAEEHAVEVVLPFSLAGSSERTALTGYITGKNFSRFTGASRILEGKELTTGRKNRK